jgi:Flp pilus assembly protein TadD
MAAETIAFDTSRADALALKAAVKYNPHLWGPDELRSIFVVRIQELHDLVERLRATPDGGVPQHILITGARGMGKTTLLRRLALAVEDDPELSARWVPVTFPKEQYTVSTLAELWRNLPLSERESAALASVGGSNGRRLLLLIDNTDLVFSNLAGTLEPGTAKSPKGRKASQGAKAARVDGGATPLWRSRNTLSHEPGLLWLGASYLALETDDTYHDAFWDFFERVELRPLQVAEMRAAMLALARTFGAGRGRTAETAEREMARNLDAHPEQLKVLRAITGGNPRTTVMLYELFAAAGADDVHSDLRRLLDTMTPLYKARIEALSDQARKLLAHLMEYWAPISARELGGVFGIATNTVSGQLTRLETGGLVEKARLRASKRAGYQAAEWLFNVWYLMRYASRRLRQRLTWLVEFMRLWYSDDELVELARHRAGQHGEGRLCRNEQLEFSRALSLALPEDHCDRYRLDWAVFGVARRGTERTSAALVALFELDGEDREYATAEGYLPRFEALDCRLARCPCLSDDTRTEWIEAVKGSLSLTLAEKESIADGSKDLSETEYRERLTALKDERGQLEQKYGEATAFMVREAVLHGRFFPDCPDSKLAHHQVMACFGEDAQALGLALNRFADHHRDEWLAKAVRRGLALNPNESWLWLYLGHLLSDQPGREKEAEAAYRRAIELEPKVALFWSLLGDPLANQPGHGKKAKSAYHRAIELEPKRAWFWYELGNLLADQPGRGEEAETAYRRAIELEPKRAWFWDDLGELLANQPGRGEEAETAYRRATELAPKEAWFWGDLGKFLTDQPGRGEEAEIAYRRAIELEPNEARFWDDLGNLLADLADRRVVAEAAYRRAIELEPKESWVWGSLGDLLAEQPGRGEEAEAAFREAIRLDPSDPYALANLARLLADLHRRPEADGASRQATALAQAADEPTAVPGASPTAEGFGHAHLLLQGHLWLGNRDLAARHSTAWRGPPLPGIGAPSTGSRSRPADVSASAWVRH